MKIETLRSFPQIVPHNRSHVVDQMKRFYMQDYDYRRLAEIDTDYIILLEWDIAVDNEDLATLFRNASTTPDEIRVAPYKIGGPHGRHWVHWKGDGRTDLRWINDGDRTCDGFGFGCIWLPVHTLRRYCDNSTNPLNDTNFSIWYRRGAIVDWDVKAVHLR